MLESEEPEGSPRSGFRSALLDIDERAEGRRVRLALGLAVFQAVIAPALDRVVRTVRDSYMIADLAKSLSDTRFAGLEFFSLSGACATVVIGGALVAGRLAAFAESSDGSWRSAAAEARLLLETEWILLLRRRTAEIAVFAAATAYIAAITARDASRLVRFVVWQGVIEPLSLETTVLALPLEGMWYFENLLEVVSFATALVGAMGIGWWMWEPPVAPASLVRSPRSFAAAHPEVQIQHVAARAQVAALFHGDLVQRALDALSTWTPERVRSERELQAELYRHLRLAGFRVVSEVQIGGRNRVDLVLDERIAIELKFGKLKANERNRVMGQSVVYAKSWHSRGPLLVICFGAPQDRVDDVTGQAKRWNRELETGDLSSLPAPILVLNQVGAVKT